MNVHPHHNQPTVELDIDLHDKQWLALETPATEILYGGAAGGGKSFLMRAAAIGWALAIPGLQIYLFRRVRDDLVKNHVEGPKGFRSLLGPFENAGICRVLQEEIRFYNGPGRSIGSQIYLCHVKDEGTLVRYQGAEIHVLLIDEATHFLENMYRFLRQRVRMVGLRDKLSPDMAKRFPRIMISANPGGVGHQWVKSAFVDAGEFKIWQTPKSEGRMFRQYIPARLEDNPSMAQDDPDYEDRIEGLGSQALVQAYRWGDWNIIEGAFFDTLTQERCGIEPFPIPRNWPRFRSMDWGSAEPFSVGWYALVVEDGFKTPCGKVLPRGAMVRYREWYGVQEKPQLRPNVGLKMTAEDVGEGILEREIGDGPFNRSVCDPSMFSEDGGPSIHSRVCREGLWFNPADNKRVAGRGAMGGWDMCRARTNGKRISGQSGPGIPMFYAFHTCRHFWRTVPALMHDKNRAEDVDTDMEDHVGDEWRYACMSRPWLPPKAIPDEDKPDTSYVPAEKTFTAMGTKEGGDASDHMFD